MYRYRSIKTELTKGLGANSGVEKDYITDWSPNNLKTLVLGSEGVIIGYHMSGKKYPNKTVLVKYKSEMADDLALLKEEPNKFIGVLKTLIDGRVFSSIEEIIFCVTNYPADLLKRDMELASLVSGNVTLETRFPRLSRVMMVKSSTSGLWDEMKDRNRDELWYDELKNTSLDMRVFHSQLEKTWFRGSALRPQYYGFDEDYLSSRFESRKQAHDDALKQLEINELKVKRSMSKMTSELPVTVNLLNRCMVLESKVDGIFKKSTIIDKAEWSYIGERKKFRSMVRSDLPLDKVAEWRRIDIPTLKWAVVEYDMSSVVKDTISNLEDMLLGYTGTDRLVGDGSKQVGDLNLSESLDRLKDFAVMVSNRQFLVIYAMLAKYLTRNSADYAVEEWGRLDYKGDFKYTRASVVYSNTYVEGLAGDVYSRIGSSVESDKFTLSFKMKSCVSVVDALEGYVNK